MTAESTVDHRGRVAGRRHRPRGEDAGRAPTSTTFWSTLAGGRSTAAADHAFDPSELPVRFGCEVPDFDPTEYLGAKEARRVDRVTQLGFAAAADALADAGEHRR